LEDAVGTFLSITSRGRSLEVLLRSLCRDSLGLKRFLEAQPCIQKLFRDAQPRWYSIGDPFVWAESQPKNSNAKQELEGTKLDGENSPLARSVDSNQNVDPNDDAMRLSALFRPAMSNGPALVGLACCEAGLVLVHISCSNGNGVAGAIANMHEQTLKNRPELLFIPESNSKAPGDANPARTDTRAPKQPAQGTDSPPQPEAKEISLAEALIGKTYAERSNILAKEAQRRQPANAASRTARSDKQRTSQSQIGFSKFKSGIAKNKQALFDLQANRVVAVLSINVARCNRQLETEVKQLEDVFLTDSGQPVPMVEVTLLGKVESLWEQLKNRVESAGSRPSIL
jgi:hypothetical protein